MKSLTMHNNGKYLKIQPQVGVYLSLMLLLIPLRWAFSWIFALTAHEVFHYLAIRLFGKRIRGIIITCSGITMHSEALLPSEYALCAISGPLGGFLLSVLATRFPRVAICGFIQSIYNLLPIRPLDGSHFLYALGCMICSADTAERIAAVAERITLIVFCCLCIVLSFKSFLGIVLLGAVVAGQMTHRK